MAQTVSLSANPRQATGKGAARQARFRGKVPAVIYGHGRDTQPLELEAKALEKALQGVEPASTIIELAVDGKTVKTLIREIQRHPIRPDIIHVDFYEIHATEKVKLKVPVHLVGNPDGVRNAGGVLDQVTREVEIEVLPENIPDRVELDVNALKIGDSLHVRDLTIPNAKILTDADLTIATVVPPRAEEVAAPSPEAATEVAEPELIRKVREGEEEEGEAGAEGGAAAKPEAKATGGGGAAPAKAEKAEKPKGGKESQRLRAVVGLGNPGPEYAATRHNAGFWLADALVARWGFPPFRRGERARVAEGEVDGVPVRVLKPTTYMNSSGAALASLRADPAFDPARDLLVLVDDFAIPTGTFRLRGEGSAGGHNGLKSIESALLSQQYARLRIGVGPLPEGVSDWSEYVLAPFTPEQREQVEAVMPQLVDAVTKWVKEGTS